MWHTCQSQMVAVWVPLPGGRVAGAGTPGSLSPGGHQVAQFLIMLLMYGVFMGGCGAIVGRAHEEDKCEQAHERS